MPLKSFSTQSLSIKFVNTHILFKSWGLQRIKYNAPLTKYVKLRVALAPGMPGTFSPPPRVSDPDMCAVMPGSLTNGFLWGRWRRKRSRHSRRMRKSQFYVSGKRPIEDPIHTMLIYCNPNTVVTIRLIRLQCMNTYIYNRRRSWRCHGESTRKK